jgi:hypothetical protein
MPPRNTAPACSAQRSGTGAPRSPWRTWAENDMFRMLFLDLPWIRRSLSQKHSHRTRYIEGWENFQSMPAPGLKSASRVSKPARSLYPPTLFPSRMTGAPHLEFPVKFVGVDELHAAFLNESRTRGLLLVPRTGNPGISLVFREMWDTTVLSL